MGDVLDQLMAADPSALTRDASSRGILDKLVNFDWGATDTAHMLKGLWNTVAYPSRVLSGEANYDWGGPQSTGEAINTAMLMAGARSPFIGQGEAGIFGGRLAKTADLDALRMAETAETMGVPRDEVWKATGWGRGADDKWRFEIPDNEMVATANPSAVSHRELFDAYPDARSIDLVLRHRAQPVGSYDGQVIRAAGPSDDVLTSVAGHEYQHGVQSREGFALGANPDEMIKAIPPELRAAYPQLSEADLNRVAYDLYKRHAGEVEARNVQSRLDWTPEQRRATPPWATEDVPRDQQIVRFGDALARLMHD